MSEGGAPTVDLDSQGSEEDDDRKPAAQEEEANNNNNDDYDDEEEPSSPGSETRPRKRPRQEESVQSLTAAAAGTASPGISLQEKWDEMFGRLQRYKRIHGNCLVPNRYKEDPSLGSWVATQRRTYKILTSGGSASSGMNVERAHRLMELGFEWSTTDPRHVPWEERYEELKAFVTANGHAEVPMRWEENVQLSNWVSKQRQDYKLVQLGKTTRLTDRRKRLLDEVGFVWEIPRKGRRLRAAKPIQNPAGSGPAQVSGSSEERDSLESLSFANVTNGTTPPQLSPADSVLASVQQVMNSGNLTGTAAVPGSATNPANTATPALTQALTLMLNSILQSSGGSAPLPAQGLNPGMANLLGMQQPPPVVQAPPVQAANQNVEAVGQFLSMFLGAVQSHQQQPAAAPRPSPSNGGNLHSTPSAAAGYPSLPLSASLNVAANSNAQVSNQIPQQLNLSALLNSRQLNPSGATQPGAGLSLPSNLQGQQQLALILLPIQSTTGLAQQLMHQQQQPPNTGAPLTLPLSLQQEIQQRVQQQLALQQPQGAAQPMVLGNSATDLDGVLASLGVSPALASLFQQQQQPQSLPQPLLPPQQQPPFLSAALQLDPRTAQQEASTLPQLQPQAQLPPQRRQQGDGSESQSNTSSKPKEDPPDHAAV